MHASDTQLKEFYMNHEYRPKAPLIRFAFFVAALSITGSVGLFIDFLATGNVAYEQGAQRHQIRPVMTASRET
jgi:hypothetical protein